MIEGGGWACTRKMRCGWIESLSRHCPLLAESRY